MGRLGKVIVGATLSLSAVGCGEEELDSGTIRFKNTDTAQFESMKDQIKSTFANKNRTKKPMPGKAEKKAEPKPDGADEKTTETKK